MIPVLLAANLKANEKNEAPYAGPYVDAGVVLHLNSDPTRDTWQMGGEGQCLFYAITSDKKRADALRKEALDKKRLGLLTVEHRSQLTALPLATNLANLVVVDDWNSAQKSGLTFSELLRVTAPFGRVFLGGVEEKKFRKEIEEKEVGAQIEAIKSQSEHLQITMGLPSKMGEWTHPIGNPGNRRVADDMLNCKILSPMLWGLYQKGIEESDRKRASLWPRFISGEHRSGPGNRNRGLLLAGGRLFGLSNLEALAWHGDETSPGQRILVVRDAFSGLVQWLNRDVGGIYAANRRAVLVKDSFHLTALTASDGTKLWSTNISGGIKNALLLDDLVVLTQGNNVQARALETGEEVWSVNTGLSIQSLMADGTVILADLGRPPRRAGEIPGPRAVLALNRADGKQLWKLNDEAFWKNAPSLKLDSVGNGRAVLLDGPKASVLNLATGEMILQIERPAEKPAHGYLGKGGGRELIQLAGDHLMMDTSKGFQLVDLEKGKKNDVPATTLHGLGAWACNGNGTFTRGTISASLVEHDSAPIEHELIGHLPVKNTCGSVPPVAYHTAYSADHKCCCGFFFGRLRGFVAGAPVDPVPPKSAFLQPGPIEQGPAFEVPIEAGPGSQWPCFRADNLRSCGTEANIPANPTLQWHQAPTTDWPQTLIARAEWRSRHLYGSRISAPVADMPSVYLALPDDHQLVALDVVSGEESWRFAACAAIDSPPTLHEGRCHFGCRDGWLYTVNARSGELIWRRRITPVDQRVQVYGQLENRFPLRGSVTVQDGRLYATAGLHGLMGVMLCVADPASGEVFNYRQLLRGAYNNDVLVADPKGKLYLGPVSLDPEETKERELAWSRHKDKPLLRVNHSKLGKKISVDYLLNVDSELLNTAKTISPIGEPQVAPAVRRVTFLLYLNGQEALNWAWNDWGQIGVRSRTLIKEKKEVTADDKLVDDQTGPVFAMLRQDLADYLDKVIGVNLRRSAPPPAVESLWQQQIGSVWAMALAGERLVVGGPVLTEDQQDPLQANGRLWVLDIKDGKLRSEIELPRSPFQDGIAISDGRIFVSLCDGSVVCLK